MFVYLIFAIAFADNLVAIFTVASFKMPFNSLYELIETDLKCGLYYGGSLHTLLMVHYIILLVNGNKYCKTISLSLSVYC